MCVCQQVETIYRRHIMVELLVVSTTCTGFSDQRVEVRKKGLVLVRTRCAAAPSVLVRKRACYAGGLRAAFKLGKASLAECEVQTLCRERSHQSSVQRVLHVAHPGVRSFLLQARFVSRVHGPQTEEEARARESERESQRPVWCVLACTFARVAGAHER